jgi:hypothetical protein
MPAGAERESGVVAQATLARFGVLLAADPQACAEIELQLRLRLSTALL